VDAAHAAAVGEAWETGATGIVANLKEHTLVGFVDLRWRSDVILPYPCCIFR